MPELGTTEDVLVVFIAGKPFGLPISCVQEVVPLVEPTPMPSWPPSALGVIELRGQLIPMVDASSALGLPIRPLSLSHFMVILLGLDRRWAVLVEGVESVRSAVVRSTDSLAPGLIRASALCRGLIWDKAGSFVLLDPEALIRALGFPTDETVALLAVGERAAT